MTTPWLGQEAAHFCCSCFSSAATINSSLAMRTSGTARVCFQWFSQSVLCCEVVKAFCLAAPVSSERERCFWLDSEKVKVILSSTTGSHACWFLSNKGWGRMSWSCSTLKKQLCLSSGNWHNFLCMSRTSLVSSSIIRIKWAVTFWCAGMLGQAVSHQSMC